MHTSLVEADDDVRAAEDALAKLLSGGPVTLTVKFDSETITQVVVQPPTPIDRLSEVRERLVEKSVPIEEAALVKTVDETVNADQPQRSVIDRHRLGYVIAGVIGFGLASMLEFALRHL